jgi:signal transduction histidine kinase
MLKLVDELLDISRIGSTVGSIKLRVMPVAEPLREVVDELRSLAQQRGLTLKLQVDDALQDAQGRIDPPRLQQVVRNVLANALRFAPTGTAVDVTLQSQDGMALVQVRDHGPGVPEDELENIFEPFVQSSRTKDGSGGTGLGLAICRQIMQAHGGFIVADNHRQGGAVFRFGLPLAAAPLKALEDETA